MATWQELARKSLESTQSAPVKEVASSDLTSLIKDPEIAKSVLKMADATAYRDIENKDKKLNLLQRLGEVFSVDEWTDDAVRALQSWYDPQTGEVTPLKGALKTFMLPADYLASGVRKVAGGVVGNKEVSRFDSPRGKDLVPQLIATGQAMFDPNRFQAKSAAKGSALDYTDIQKDMGGAAKFASGALGMVLDTVATPSFWLSGSSSAVGKLAGKGSKEISKGLKTAVTAAGTTGVASMDKLAVEAAEGLAAKALTASGLELTAENIAGVIKSSNFIKETLQKTLPKGLYKVGPLTKGATALKTGAVADTVARYIDNPLFAAIGDVWGKTKGIKVNDAETLGSTMDDMVSGVKEKLTERYAIKKFGGDAVDYHTAALAHSLNSADYQSKVRQNAIAHHMLKIKESGNTDAINQAEGWIASREYWTGSMDATTLEGVLGLTMENPKQRKMFWDLLEKGQEPPTYTKVVEEVPEAKVVAEGTVDNPIKGDLWDQDGVHVVTTNMGGVHGKGLAKQARDMGLIGKENFNVATSPKGKNVITLAVKGSAPETALKKGAAYSEQVTGKNLELLDSEINQLIEIAKKNPSRTFYMPYAGMGFGEGKPEEILPILRKLDAQDNIKMVAKDESVISKYAEAFKPGIRADKAAVKAVPKPAEDDLAREIAENDAFRARMGSAPGEWAEEREMIGDNIQSAIDAEIDNSSVLDGMTKGNFAKEMEDLDLEETLLESGFSKGDLDLIGQKGALDTLKTRHYLPRTQKFIDDYVRENPESLQASMFKGERAKDLDRAYAHALATNEGELFKKLPEDLRNIWASQTAKDPEVGGLIKVGQEGDMHGSHWFNAQMEYDHLNDTLLDKEIAANAIPAEWADEGGRFAPLDTKDYPTQILEHPVAGYPARTKANIEAADITLLFSKDMDGGSKLTADLAKKLKKPLISSADFEDTEQIAEALANQIKKENPFDVIEINVAGNRLTKLNGMTQEQVNEKVYQIFKSVREKIGNGVSFSIRSGGQTGVDEAAIKAGQKLGVPTTVLAPKGFERLDGRGKEFFEKIFTGKEAKPTKQVIETNPMLEEYKKLTKEGDAKKLEEFLIGDDEGYQIQGRALEEWTNQTTKAEQDVLKIQPRLDEINSDIDTKYDTLESLERRYGELKDAVRREGRDARFVAVEKKEMLGIQKQVREINKNLKTLTEERSELSRVVARHRQLTERLAEKEAKFGKYRSGIIKRREQLILASQSKYTPKPYREGLAQLYKQKSQYKDQDFDMMGELLKKGYSEEMAFKAINDPTGFEKYLRDEFEVEYYKRYVGSIRNWARKAKAKEMALRGEVGEITYDSMKEGDVLTKTPNNLDALTAEAMFKVSDDEVEELAQKLFEKDFPGAKISEVESDSLDIIGDLKRGVDSTSVVDPERRLLFREQNFDSLAQELEGRFGYTNRDGSDAAEIAESLKRNIRGLTDQLSRGKNKGLRVEIFLQKAAKEMESLGYEPEGWIKEDPVVLERAIEMMSEVKGVQDSLDMEIIEKIVHEQNLLEVHELLNGNTYQKAMSSYAGEAPIEGSLPGKDIFESSAVKNIDRDIEWRTENDILKKLGEKPSEKLSGEFDEVPLLKEGVPSRWEQYLDAARSRYLRDWEKNNIKQVKKDIISEVLDTTDIKGVDDKVKFVKEAEDTINKAVRSSVVDTGGVLTEAEEKTGMFLAKMQPKITGKTRIVDLDPIQLDNILTQVGFAGPGKDRLMAFIYGFKQEVAQQEMVFNQQIVPWIEKTLLPDAEKQDLIMHFKGLKDSSLLDMSIAENRKKVLNDVLVLERRFKKIAQTGDARDQMAAQTMLEVFLRPMKEHAATYMARKNIRVRDAAGKLVPLETLGLLGTGHRSLDVPEEAGEGVGNIVTMAKRKYANQAVLEGYNAMGVADPIKMKTDVESIVKDVVGYQVKEEKELLAFHEHMGNLIADLKAGKGGEGIKLKGKDEVLDPKTWFEVKGVPGLDGQGVYVTKELKPEFDMLARFWKRDNVKGAMKYVRFFNNIWKGVQTGSGVDTPQIKGKLYKEAERLGLKDFVDFYNEQAAFIPLSPAFTFRNTIGNLTASLLKGELDIRDVPARLSEAAEIQRAILRAEGASEFNQGLMGVLKSKIPQEQLDQMVEEIQKSGLLTETQVGNELIKNPEVTGKFLGKITSAATENKAMKFNNNMEMIWKIAVFRNARQAGKSVEDAVNTVHKALFDYSALSAFEQEYIRPYTVFYTWTKKNVELMADLMINEPQKFKFYSKLLMEMPSQFSNISDEEREKLPDWTENMIGIPYSIGGETRYLSGFGGNLESFMEVMGAGGDTFGEQIKGGAMNAVDMLAPAFKIPFNLVVTGQNTFKGIPIEEDTSAYGYRALPAFMKKALGISEKQWVDKEGNTGSTYRMDGEKKYLIESTLGRASTVPLKALSVLSGEDRPVAGLMDLALGLKTTRYDTDYLKYNDEKEQREALMRELERLGLVTQYTGYGYNTAGAQLNQPLIDEYLKSLAQ